MNIYTHTQINVCILCVNRIRSYQNTALTCLFFHLIIVCAYLTLSVIGDLHLFKCLSSILLCITPLCEMLILFSVFAIINIKLIDILINIS